MTLTRYLSHRRRNEVLLWVLFFGINWAANLVVFWTDLRSAELATPFWELLVWETTSTLVVAALIPLILIFDARYPIRTSALRRGLGAHALFTLPFSLIHVTAMYWLRKGIYAVVGATYEWAHWWSDFGYEYLKDFRSYLSIIAIIYLYRFIILRLQGEAEFLSEGREEAEPVAVTDRFLVKKLGREFLVRVNDIDWIEASGNYVNLHVGGRLYPLRETMAGIEARLMTSGFVRVHRSAILNLDRVAEIVPYDTGDGEARLTTDVRVPVSRRYRKELRERLG